MSTKALSITVLNADGRVIISQDKGSNDYSLNISQLKVGIYVILDSAGNRIRFLKQ